MHRRDLRPLSRRFAASIVTIFFLLLGNGITYSQDGLFELPPRTSSSEFDVQNGNPENVEVLARGPIHEAFATPTGQEPLPNPVVPRQPPEPVRETPPELTASDAQSRPYTWIPGYWFWDEEREDFIWISGLWRVEPEGRKWMPGYWEQVADGWSRVAGFWSVAGTEEFQYVQRPPQSLEIGPTTPAPSDQHFWVPGTWVQEPTIAQETENVIPFGSSSNTFASIDSFHYQWRPGYWNEYRANHVWIPDHYVATPSRCVFVPGYWDYALPARGELYAPIYCPRPIVSFQPTCPVVTSNLLLHLFVAQNQRCYLFGDYYGARNLGYHPIYDYRRATHRYDPLISYYNVYFSQRGIKCRSHLHHWNRYYTSNVAFRPPRSLSVQSNLSFTNVNVGRGGRGYARPPQSCLIQPREPRKSRPAISVQANQMAKRSAAAARAQFERNQRLARQRQKMEKQIAVAARPSRKPGRAAKPQKIHLPPDLRRQLVSAQAKPDARASKEIPPPIRVSAKSPKAVKTLRSTPSVTPVIPPKSSKAPNRNRPPSSPLIVRSQNDVRRAINLEKNRVKDLARQASKDREQRQRRLERERREAQQAQAKRLKEQQRIQQQTQKDAQRRLEKLQDQQRLAQRNEDRRRKQLQKQQLQKQQLQKQQLQKQQLQKQQLQKQQLQKQQLQKQQLQKQQLQKQQLQKQQLQKQQLQKQQLQKQQLQKQQQQRLQQQRQQQNQQRRQAKERQRQAQQQLDRERQAQRKQQQRQARVKSSKEKQGKRPRK